MTRVRPSLRRPSLSSGCWYATVTGGWALLIGALFELRTTSIVPAGPSLIMTAVLLVVLELRPIVGGGRHDPQGVVMSTAFVCAMLFMWGIWPAIVVLSIATLSSELRRRKPPYKLFFNVAQYNVSVASGWLVMAAAGRTPSLDHPLGRFTGRDMLWVFGVWVVYFTVNATLVSAALAWTSSFRDAFFDDFAYYAATTFSVLALSPLVVVVAQTQWVLLPLLLVPLALVYKTAQMSLEKEFRASHDSLTGLPNRHFLITALTDALARSVREGRPCGLLLLDLDHFKEVNDTLGHHVGDHLLTQFAARLQLSVRPEDVVARLGGDEFAIIVPDADEAQVRAVAERIRAVLGEPVVLNGMPLDVEASIGLAMHPAHGQEALQLLRLADVAMYVAKESRAGIAAYSVGRDRNSTDRLGLLGELRHALDHGDLELHYQPKTALEDGALLGVEALLRWPHADRGLVRPDDFIPLAERSGIMPLLTEHVVNIALAQMAAWRSAGLHVPVAVNVSITDLGGTRLTSLLAAGLQEYRLPPGMLKLEITERVVAQHTEELDEVLFDLKRMGVTLSLDDFGTGYSSLLRLQSLPIDELKIDHAFVSRLADGAGAAAMVQVVVDLAHALGIPTVAEGVETAEQWQQLRGLGCDGAQGWFIAAAMPAAEATAWIRTRVAAVPPRAAAVHGDRQSRTSAAR